MIRKVRNSERLRKKLFHLDRANKGGLSLLQPRVKLLGQCVHIVAVISHPCFCPLEGKHLARRISTRQLWVVRRSSLGRTALALNPSEHIFLTCCFC